MKPKIIFSPPGPKAKKIIARDKKIMSNSLTRVYDLVVEKGKGANLWDIDGNCYLDFNSCIAVMNLGYSNEKILNALKGQLEKITHGAFSDFYGKTPLRFSEKLIALVKNQNLKRVFLSNSGTESIEAAIKLAKFATKRKYLLAFYDCFHGRSLGALSLTCSKRVHRAGFGPFIPTIHVPYPNCYRNPFNLEEPSEVANATMAWIEDYVFAKKADPNEIAAVFFEPILGEGGYVVPPKKFVKDLKKICSANGILLVVDEVQSGCLRTGKFLAIENFEVTGDIVCLAKGIANGFPLGATLFKEVLNLWPPYSHANTFGGNFVSCAAGEVALDLYSDKNLARAVVKKGKEALKFLNELKAKSKIIGDVRGMGLMIGLEIVKDKKTKAFGTEICKKIILNCFKKGLLLLSAGTHSNVIRIAPPLIISEEDFNAGLEILASEIKKLE